MKNDEIIYRPLGLSYIRSNLELEIRKVSTDFPYHGIWVCSGSQGAGKTLFAVSVLRDIYKKYPNVKIYSNINLYGIPYLPYTGLECFDDTNGVDGIIYLIDEIHTLYSSLESAKMSGNMLTVWSQNRKNVRLILGTSQRWSRVAKPIREQAIYNIECRPTIIPCLYKYRCVDATEYDDNGKLPPEADKVRYHFYIPNPESKLMYDTKEVVHSTNEVIK